MKMHLLDDDRSPEAIAFLKAVVELQKQHGFVLGTFDQGECVVERRSTARDPEADDEWLLAATEVRP